MYDVIIIGGGVSGCAAARELSRYQADILVLDKEEDVTCHNYFAQQHTKWVEKVLLERSKIIKTAVDNNELYIAKCHLDHDTGLVDLID